MSISGRFREEESQLTVEEEFPPDASPEEWERLSESIALTVGHSSGHVV